MQQADAVMQPGNAVMQQAYAVMQPTDAVTQPADAGMQLGNQAGQRANAVMQRQNQRGNGETKASFVATVLAACVSAIVLSIGSMSRQSLRFPLDRSGVLPLLHRLYAPR
jgi:hypothetical protein